MWIVRLALRRPYTFVILALLIAVLGIFSIVTMTVDIFPRINIPVVTLLTNQLSLAQAVNLHMAASIRLIKSLGGGWNP